MFFNKNMWLFCFCNLFLFSIIAYFDFLKQWSHLDHSITKKDCLHSDNLHLTNLTHNDVLGKLSTQSDSDVPVPLLSMHGIKRVSINIGSNYDPILPDANDPAHAVLAFEPDPRIVSSIIAKQIPRLLIVAAAVSNFSGITKFTLFNNNGVSSSLSSKALVGGEWINQGIEIVVPVLSFTNILSEIPSDVMCDHLKTDMQGYDMHALQSVGLALRKCKTIMSETWVDRAQSTYDVPTPNDIQEFKSYMPSVGFRFVKYIQDYNEGDSYWERID